MVSSLQVVESRPVDTAIRHPRLLQSETCTSPSHWSIALRAMCRSTPARRLRSSDGTRERLADMFV